MAPCSSSAGYQPAGARATSPRRQVAGAPAAKLAALQRLDRIEVIDQARPLADVAITRNAEPHVELRRVRCVAFHHIDEAAMLEDDDLPVLVVVVHRLVDRA